jgi:hypothetical protein
MACVCCDPCRDCTPSQLCCCNQCVSSPCPQSVTLTVTLQGLSFAFAFGLPAGCTPRPGLLCASSTYRLGFRDGVARYDYGCIDSRALFRSGIEFDPDRYYNGYGWSNRDGSCRAYVVQITKFVLRPVCNCDSVGLVRCEGSIDITATTPAASNSYIFSTRSLSADIVDLQLVNKVRGCPNSGTSYPCTGGVVPDPAFGDDFLDASIAANPLP